MEKPVKKQVGHRRTAKAAGVVLALLACAWYFLPTGVEETFMTRGHISCRTAVPATGEPGCEPSQVMALPNGMTLEVYDRGHKFDGGNGPSAPVVVLRDADGTRKWAVYSHTGHDQSSFNSDLRFNEVVSCRLMRVMIVSGTVGSDPTQHTTWYITRSGKLRDRWYIWENNWLGGMGCR